MKTSYEKSIYDEQIKVPLIISSSSEIYERTFPKYELRHQEYLDPTYFTKAEFPTYININGLKEPSQTTSMLLQK